MSTAAERRAEAGRHPASQEDIDATTAFLFDGLIDTRGRILNAINNRLGTQGVASDVSPEYFRFVSGINDWADRYPHNDPRTWVPLVQAGIRAGTFDAQNIMDSDATRLSDEGANSRPEGTPQSAAAAAIRPQSVAVPLPPVGDPTAQPPGGEEITLQLPSEAGFSGMLKGVLGLPGKAWDISGGDSLWDKSGADSLWDKSGADSLVNETLDSSLVKGTSRNFFGAASMPYQAIVGTGANVYDDMKDHHYKSALLHTLAVNPVFEAEFVGAENLTGSDFYRQGGAEPTNWGQTDFGQTVLDIFGQGKGENQGGPDDAAGFSNIDQGSGFFINPESEIGKAQQAARLAAGPVAEASAGTEEQQRALNAIAMATTPEQAAEYANKLGLAWSPDDHQWMRPALGFTFGRAFAGQFTDPGTESYNNLAGIVDTGSGVVFDPMTWVPGGVIKSGVSGIAAGTKIIKTGDDALVLLRAEQSARELAMAGATQATTVTSIRTAARNGERLVDGYGNPLGSQAAAIRHLKDGHEVHSVPGAGAPPQALDEVLMGPKEIKDALAEGQSIAEVMKNNGGTLASQAAWNYLNTGIGDRIVQGIAEETDPFTLWQKSNGKIRPELAYTLAQASTPEDVRRALAPVIGIDFQRSRELAGFATKTPMLHMADRVARPGDLDAVKRAWVRHVPGQGFMPGHEFDLGNMQNGMTQLTRWVGVGLGQKAMDDPELRAAFSRYMATGADSGRAGYARRWQTVYGHKGEDVLFDAQGNQILTATELKQRLASGLTPESLEAKGFTIGALGEDGIFATVAKKLVAEEGLPPASANRLVKAWSPEEDQIRRYAQDGLGNDALLPWDTEPKAGPFQETDVLQRMAALPDVREVRRLTGVLGPVLRRADAEGNPARAAQMIEFADDLTETMMRHWKQATLSGMGVRYPAYVMRQILDTHMTAAMSGGANIITSPRELFGLLATSTVRQAVHGETRRGRLSAAVSRSDNPLSRMLFRESLSMDAEGDLFEHGLQRFMNGDADGADDMAQALNMSAGRRGSQGNDEWFNNQAANYVNREVDNPEHWRDYSHGMVGELHKFSQNPTARALVDPSKDFDTVVDDFMNSTKNGRAVVEQFGPKAADFLKTRQGVVDYLMALRAQIRTITGDDPDLLNAIYTRKFDDNSLLIPKGHNGDRVPNQALIDHLRGLRDNSPTTLPSILSVRPTKGWGAEMKGMWDNMASRFFHSAGLWEDTYARDPFYREKYADALTDLAPMLTPEARAEMVADLRRTNSPKLASRIEKAPAGPAIATRADVHRVATTRAHKAISDIAYDAANRREWAYAMRVMSPFVQATVNGMYRWSKALLQNPESTYKLQRAARFLTSDDSAFIGDYSNAGGLSGDPFVYEDPQTLERRVTVPMSGLFIDMAANVYRAIGNKDAALPPGANPGFSLNAGSLDLAFPGYGQASAQAQASGGKTRNNIMAQAVWPGVGPFVSAPVALISDGSEQWVHDYVFPYGGDTGSGTGRITDSIMPSSLSRIFDVIKPSPEQEAQRGARVLTMTGMILADEAQKDPSLTGYDQTRWDSAFDRAKGADRALALIQGLFGGQFPSSGAIDTTVSGQPQSVRKALATIYKDPDKAPDHMIFAKMLGDIYNTQYSGQFKDQQTAEGQFVRDYGLAAIMLAAPSGDNSDTAPPLFTVAALKAESPESYDKYGSILKYFPVRDGSGFDIDLYTQQIASGERDRYTLDDRIKVAKQAVLDYLYYSKRDAIEQSHATDLSKEWAKNALNADLEEQGWDGASLGQTLQQRNHNIDLIAETATDPAMFKFIGGKTTAAAITRYTDMREQMIAQIRDRGGAGDLRKSTAAAKQQRSALFALGTSYSQQDPGGFGFIWDRYLRYEVAPAEEDQ